MLRECCQKAENRQVLPVEQADRQITQCQVCQRKHYEITLDPGKFQMKLT